MGTNDSPHHPTTHSPHLLDRWVLSELNLLVRNVTEAMETYDVLGATRPIAEFVDSVSNWYVRLSRRRFWDGDAAALSTLHEVLVTVAHLLAPTTPFVADEIYQNLVQGSRKAGEQGADSVHLSSWPKVNTALIDEQLSVDMALAQKVTSLAHAARQNANLKVRQPLAEVVVRTRNADEEASLQRLSQLVLDELNVKSMKFTQASGDLVDVVVFPYPKQLGQKYGKGYPKIRAAMTTLDQAELAARFQAGETVEVNAEGESFAIAPEDVDVRVSPRSGFSVAEANGYFVAVTTTVSKELEVEGNARELVRRIQQLRKDAGLEISDRIVLALSGPSLVNDVVSLWGSYIKDETLAVEMSQSAPDEGMATVSFELGDGEVTVGLRKR